MTSITIHSKDDCPYCEAAKDFLKSKAVPFTEIKHNDDADRNALYDSLGLTGNDRTVPQIIIHEGGEDFLLGGSLALKMSRIETLFTEKTDHAPDSPGT